MRPSVVICGSYHQDSDGLQRLFRELEITGCRILSPISVAFKDTSTEIVRADHEDNFNIDELERFHLRALASADFVMLHVPSGHVGLSGAFELGYANALNKPVYSLCAPTDAMLATRVLGVSSVFEILDQLELISF